MKEKPEQPKRPYNGYGVREVKMSRDARLTADGIARDFYANQRTGRPVQYIQPRMRYV